MCATRPGTFPGHLWVCYVIAAALNENTVHVRDRQHHLSHTGGLRVVEGGEQTSTPPKITVVPAFLRVSKTLHFLSENREEKIFVA